MQVELGQYILRWSIGGDYLGAVAQAPIFLLIDPADEPGARVAAKRLRDGFGALARAGGIPDAHQVRRVWNDAMTAAESDLATITLMATDVDMPSVNLGAVLLAVVEEDGHYSWLVHSMGSLTAVHDDGTSSSEVGGDFRLQPMRAGERFVLLSQSLREAHSAGRIRNVISQLPRAQRAAAVLVSDERNAATAVVVDVHDAVSIAALDFPETLMAEDLDEEVSEPSLTSDWALQALGIAGHTHASEQPLTAPELDDFVFESYLGSGGYADVFLYEEQTPKRLVAIKVGVGSGKGRSGDFRSEIDVMGQLGGHPSIVSIFDADVAPTGQPYIVMQYCPGPSLAERLVDGPLPIDEVLRMGIQLSGATHTAHMLGIAHYDIKPSNVLTTAFGRFALSDFGIAQIVGNSSTDVTGMSLPWAAPEALRGEECTYLADVYSMGATLYTAIYGHAPFATAGLGKRAYIERVQSADVDYPQIPGVTGPAFDKLVAVLAGALERDVNARTASVDQIGRGLQEVQSELGLAVTELEIPAS
ncbi:serine/threonine protein kinase [Trueperella pecoris]|uniref:non-specific serine/threonine protein kinase n=1 Tax=Trueperella pecoris TaxID=2733571 RepID=A0A7M1QY74_9ACTO|nr:serine/threonine-protein kinase [Trueperella pecoris]QOR46806.1 serine/threonine protein kinase [Trueperella pecoris]